MTAISTPQGDHSIHNLVRVQVVLLYRGFKIFLTDSFAKISEDTYLDAGGNWLSSTYYYEFRIVRFFQGPKNPAKQGPHVSIYNT